MEDEMYNLTEAAINEIRNFLTFKNINNFDEYYVKVLPKNGINKIIIKYL
jgi:hypothetical protein